MTRQADTGGLTVAGCDVLAAPGAPLLRGADIAIEHGRIAAIEPSGEQPPRDGATVIDGRGLLAIPGLVNAHVHSPESPLRGVGEGLPLELWLCTMLNAGGLYTPGDHYACALACAVEMLRNGTTTVVDHLWATPPSVEAADAAMRAYRDAGIRAAVAPLVADTDHTEDLARARGIPLDGPLLPGREKGAPPNELAAQLDELMSRWHGAEDGRLHVLAGPMGLPWCSEELLSAVAGVAQRHGSRIHIHLLETWLEDLTCRHRFGQSAVRGAADLGILAGTSLAHGVWIGEEDMPTLAEHGAIVVHNPASNMRLASGCAPVRALLDAGVTVALGTDGGASSDNQVIWDALKLAALIHNDGERWVSSTDALRMATSGGAAVLGLEQELGTLEPGKLADITLVDRSGDGLAGAHALEPSLALSETGRGVRHVIVAGELVVRDGHCTRVDERAALAGLAEQARRRAPDGPLPPETVAAMRRFEVLRTGLSQARKGHSKAE